MLYLIIDLPIVCDCLRGKSTRSHDYIWTETRVADGGRRGAGVTDNKDKKEEMVTSKNYGGKCGWPKNGWSDRTGSIVFPSKNLSCFCSHVGA